MSPEGQGVVRLGREVQYLSAALFGKGEFFGIYVGFRGKVRIVFQ